MRNLSDLKPMHGGLVNLFEVYDTTMSSTKPLALATLDTIKRKYSKPCYQFQAYGSTSPKMALRLEKIYAP